jgi:hypothetical protein
VQSARGRFAGGGSSSRAITTAVGMDWMEGFTRCPTDRRSELNGYGLKENGPCALAQAVYPKRNQM